MPSWLLKAAVQGAISLPPGRHRLNYLLQRHVTRSLALSEAGFHAKVSHCRHHLASFARTHGSGRPPAAVLELGTGWYPIVPVGLALAGAHQVTTIDLNPLLDASRVRCVLEHYEEALATGRLERVLPGLDPDRALDLLAAARGLQRAGAVDLLAAVGVDSRVGDVRHLRLAPRSIELLVSNNTLEHIPQTALAEVLPEFHRVAAPDAVMDHFIDLSDHYAHFDPSISEFNYLRYGDAIWRLFNNRLQFQNRLRASDYRRLFEQAGFRVVAEESERGTPEQLATIKLAPGFSRYGEADLLVIRTWLTATAAR